jgi:hypothetical protein
MNFLHGRLSHSKSFDCGNRALLQGIDVRNQVRQTWANGAEGQEGN